MGIFKSMFGKKKSGDHHDDVIDIDIEGSEDSQAKSGSSLVQRLRRKSKREQQLEALQAGYGELLGLIRSIRTHMDGQSATQEKLLEVMQGMPDAMEGLKAVGRATEQQSAAINRFADSMTGFNQALGQIDETNKSLAERTKESEGLLKDMLRRSERRMAALLTVLVIICIGALGVGVYLNMEGGRGLSFLQKNQQADAQAAAPTVEEKVAVEAVVEDTSSEAEAEE
ncbi:MAG: hypothetical protein KJ626_02415 [Verrucomicrobia bacterium]|nr:hypothetical protein [Verrucomicrobiota bacterium]